MAIKDKSGNVYKLQGPNPLMKTQNQNWDKNKLTLLNMGWDEKISVDERNPVKKFETDFNVVDIGKELDLNTSVEESQSTVIDPMDFIGELEKNVPFEQAPIEQEIPVAIVKEVPVVQEPVVQENVLNVDQKIAKVMRERGVECYCAPAIGKKNHTDNLYGSSYTTIEYGNKFLFDAIIVDESDFQLQCWCVKPISINSIIYRKIKSGGERWWKVSDIEEKSGGYLILCVVSDLNPDFS